MDHLPRAPLVLAADNFVAWIVWGCIAALMLVLVLGVWTILRLRLERSRQDANNPKGHVALVRDVLRGGAGRAPDLPLGATGSGTIFR
jgi:hypothetical protein